MNNFKKHQPRTAPASAVRLDRLVMPFGARPSGHEWTHAEPGEPWLTCEHCGIEYSSDVEYEPCIPYDGHNAIANRARP
jgi:hypothetical protein